jgi:hypothetical protein
MLGLSNGVNNEQYELQTITTPTIHKIPLIPPFAKGGNCYPPLWKRGARGDFLIKPLNISVLHRAINAICRSSTMSYEERGYLDEI